MPSQRSPRRRTQPTRLRRFASHGTRRATRASAGRWPMQRSRRRESAHRLAPRRRLDLHPRHVDAGRAVALAALAADAQGERLLHRVARQRLGRVDALELARERQAQRVRPAAGQVLLVAGDAKARAHRAGVELAAVAVVVAHLDRLGEAAARVAAAARRGGRFGERIVLHVPRRPVERRLQRNRPVGRRIAEQARRRPSSADRRSGSARTGRSDRAAA